MEVASAVRATSRKQSTDENLQESARRMMVMGAPGTGKSTFSASASRFAGDTLPLAEPVKCTDVAVIQGDNEGMLGARACGLIIPNIFDMTACTSYDEYITTLRQDLKEIAAMVRTGEVKYLIIDLNFPDSLLQSKHKPGNQKEWGEVKYDGYLFYKMFSSLRKCALIGNCHIKTTETPGETSQAAASSAAQTVGGERNTYTMDLCKGIKLHWALHSSLTVTVERKFNVRDPVTKQKKAESFIYTQSNGKYEAKSRFGSLFQPVEPGHRTLHSMLKQAYGNAL